MIKPHELKVGNHTFAIRWGKLSSEDDGASAGRTYLRKTIIEIDDTPGDWAATQVRDTLFHEALHAAFVDGILDFDDGQEEMVVRVLAPAMLFILRNNPDFVNFLLEN